MTINEFRNDPSLVEMWQRELKTNELLKTVLEVMDFTHPARFALHGDKNEDISPTRAAIELGTTRGYSMYADRLKILATTPAKYQQVGESDYSSTEKLET